MKQIFVHLFSEHSKKPIPKLKLFRQDYNFSGSKGVKKF